MKSRKINRERIEPGNEGKNIVTQDNCQEQNGTRIYRRGQKLGVYEAPRRRRLIDLTSRIPQPLTIYTNWVPPLQRIYISAERENKTGRTANHHCKKKSQSTCTFWYLRVVKSFKPWTIGLSTVKWQRQTDFAIYRL